MGLQNGVRGFMLDMYTAFQPAVNILKEFQVFLDKNKDVVVTLILEDYVKSSNGLSRVFDASGLRNSMFAVRRITTRKHRYSDDKYRRYVLGITVFRGHTDENGRRKFLVRK
ncbi:hypothetical protein DY000_02042389 [Brassica cretica]|uniref:Uncharacterized protein n=1 Tax=Brassica cretica TaxID=69181 RepID=A0ABQ7BNE3_BRACR|nr:hypothetical protein DY000_02042389 [Brassica cretica]